MVDVRKFSIVLIFIGVLFTYYLYAWKIHNKIKQNSLPTLFSDEQRMQGSTINLTAMKIQCVKAHDTILQVIIGHKYISWTELEIGHVHHWQ